MLIKIVSIYDFLSLISFAANIYIFLSMNFILIIGFFISLISHGIIKLLTNDLYAPVFKRPDGAYNCSLFNTGGLVNNYPGFPSGHVTVISFFINYMFFTNYFNNQNVSIKNIVKKWKIYLLYNIPVILVSIGRLGKKCHNIYQVIGGYILGFIISNFLFSNEKNINDLKKYITNNK